MRPNAIVNFERLFLGSIVLSTVQLALQANERIGGIGPVTQFIVGAGVILLSVILVLLVSRRRSGIARWVLAAITVAAVATEAFYLASGAGIDGISAIGTVVVLMQAAAVGFLFTGDARDWFARRVR